MGTDFRHCPRALILLLVLAVPAVAAGDGRPTLAGQSLESAIGALQQAGFKVFYSSDLVRGWMRVEQEPGPEDPAAALAEILDPHGLALRRGLNDAWLVVRDPDPPRADAALAPGSPQPDARTEKPALPVEEIIVAASRYEIRRAGAASEFLISNRDLENLPDIGDDSIRAVARLPGTASNGLSALANIRGGEINETLVRLDGLRLYEPFHLKDFQGVFSAIDPRIVSSMDVYTGAFPAAFGDRMSGVIDVETIIPPERLYHEVGLSFFNSSFLSSGNFAGERGHWIGSVRRSNLDLLYRKFSEQPERPRYTDLYAKLSFDLSEQLTITGNLLRAEDDIALADDVDREERASARQADSYAWLKLEHRLGGRTSGATLIAQSRIDSARSGTSAKLGVSAGSLSDTRSFSIDSVQSEWSRILGARLMLDFGVTLTRLEGRYAYADAANFDLVFDFPGAPTEIGRVRSIAVNPTGRRHELFTALRIDLNPRLATEIGLRWDQQTIDGSGQSTLGPRLGFSWAVSEMTTLRANWGRIFQAQAINELQVNDGVTRFQPPQRSEHFVIGLDRVMAGGAMLRIEAYDKSLDRLRPRFENLLNTRVLLPELKPDRIRVAPDSARARGVEISLDGEDGPWRWWTGLTWARVEDRIDRSEVLRSWDQTFNLQLGMSYERSGWTFSTGLIYRSGWPTTGVSLVEGAAFPTVEVGPRNGDRSGAFGSLDIRVSREFSLEDSALVLSFEMSNVTDRMNPCCFEYEIGDEEDTGELVLGELNYLPTIPSLGVLWKF